MTFEEQIRAELTTVGVFFESDNDGIFQAFKKDYMEKELNADLLAKSTDGYPDTAFAALWLGVKISGLKWIDENKPQAFYKPSFVVGDEDKPERKK